MKNTIVECVFDITYESTNAPEGFLSLIASVDSFDNLKKLPLSQIPETIRKSDPNLRNQPIYEITSSENKEYKVMLGDNTIGLAIVNEYSSWTSSMYPEIEKLFGKILTSGKIDKINRMGLRYTDFLENENIFDSGKVKINIDNNVVADKTMFVSIEDKIENISYIKVITNKKQYQYKDGKLSENKGSIVDIVTSLENQEFNLSDMNNIFTLIDKLHKIHREKLKEVVSDKYSIKYSL